MSYNTAEVVLWILFIAFTFKAKWTFFNASKRIVQNGGNSERVEQDKFVVAVNMVTSLLSVAVVFVLGGCLIFLRDIFLYVKAM